MSSVLHSVDSNEEANNLPSRLKKKKKKKFDSRHRTQKLCESGGGRPELPIPNSPYSLRGRKATLNSSSELRSYVKVDVDILGSTSLIVLLVSVDVTQHWTGRLAVPADMKSGYSARQMVMGIVCLWAMSWWRGAEVEGSEVKSGQRLELFDGCKWTTAQGGVIDLSSLGNKDNTPR